MKKTVFVIFILMLMIYSNSTTASGLDQYKRYDYFKFSMKIDTYLNNKFDNTYNEQRLYTYLGVQENKLAFNLVKGTPYGSNFQLRPVDEANYLVDPNTGLMYDPSRGQDSVVYTADANTYKVNDTINTPLNETVDAIIDYSFSPNITRNTLQLTNKYENATYSLTISSLMDKEFGFYYSINETITSDHYDSKDGIVQKPAKWVYTWKLLDFHIQSFQGALSTPFVSGFEALFPTDPLIRFELILMLLSIIIVSVFFFFKIMSSLT